MLGWPGSDWTEMSQEAPQPAPPCPADWRLLPGEVRHTFTHFHLILTVYVADLPPSAQTETGQFLPQSQFRPSDLPTVMRKAFDLSQSTAT